MNYDEQLIKVYIQTNDQQEITAINSQIFVDNPHEWQLIDQGLGDKYAHAQSAYLPQPLQDSTGKYRYKFVNHKIVSQ